LRAALLAACALTAWLLPAHAQEAPLISSTEWAAYQEKFVDGTGRVIDDANGNISHSEGQGYGMLLAYEAGDRAAFARIWSFTQTELLLRDDGLAVWKWDPSATPHVVDANNATDGDLLIAYALSLAGKRWPDTSYTASAATIAEAIGRETIQSWSGMVLLKPGVAGFGPKDRPDGPVVNPSYWIFEALPAMQALAPAHDWEGLRASGLAILARLPDAPSPLPPDWLSLHAAPKPAAGFDPVFGYNALRIPLYLIRAQVDRMDLVERMLKPMSGKDGGLALVDVTSGAATATLSDPGYRIQRALAACMVDGQPIPAELMTFTPTQYYPSTLHLLALSHIREARPPCG